MIGPKDILDVFSASPGDTAAGLVGYAAGFAADVFFFAGGVEPGTTAGVSAAAAIGAKRSVESLLGIRSSKRQIDKKARVVLKHLGKKARESAEAKSIADEFEHDYLMWKDNLYDDEVLVQRINEAIEYYRTSRKTNAGQKSLIEIKETTDVDG